MTGATDIARDRRSAVSAAMLRMTRMHVRKATAEDIDAIIRVGASAWRATYPEIAGEAYVEKGIARWWTPEAVRPGVDRGDVLVAEPAPHHGVVGVAAYGERDDHLMLWKLYVHPDAQGSGAGRALLAEVVAAARRAGVPRIRLTHLVGNDRAHAVYERAGFTEVGRERSPIEGGPDEIVMELPLDA